LPFLLIYNQNPVEMFLTGDFISNNFLSYALYACILAISWFIFHEVIPNPFPNRPILTPTQASKSALSGPLSVIPGPALNKWTVLPLLFSGTAPVLYVHALHDKYGAVVRVAPNHVSVSDVKDVKAIHKIGSGFVKSRYYEFLHLAGTLVCLVNNREHTERRKLFAKAFSQQNLLGWENMLKFQVRSTMESMKGDAADDGEVDMLSHFTWMARDIITELCFGDTDLDTDDGRDVQRKETLGRIKKEMTRPKRELVKNLPLHLRLIPRPFLIFIRRSRFLSPFTVDTLASELVSSDEGKQTVFTRVLEGKEKNGGKKREMEDDAIVKEARAFIFAGTDTTAVTATYLIWVILKHPGVLERLKKEVADLREDFGIEEVQRLQLLRNVIQETLRLYGAVAGGLPRQTPNGGRTFGEGGKYFVPEGTTVTTQSYTLHRNPLTFDDPLE
jgi:cytochrome P450